MAAATLALGVPQTVTSGTADNVRLVNLPTGHGWIKIRPRTTAGKLKRNYSGSDDAAISGDYETLPADTDSAFDTSAGPPTLGLASTGASVEFECLVMPRGMS